MARTILPTFTDAAKTRKAELVKDNAKPRVKPPEIARSPEPALAPPGMSGIRTEKRFAFRASPAPVKDFSPTQGNLKREFKPLAQTPTNCRDIDR